MDSFMPPLPPSGGAAAGETFAISKSRFVVGSRVEGSPRSDRSDARVYAGVVTAVNGDGTLSVAFIGVPGSSAGSITSTVMDLDAVTLLSPPGDGLTAAELKPGLTVLAKYTGDSKWYTARVDTCNSDLARIVVTFTEYGNSETVPLEYIRRQAEVGAAAAGAPSASASSASSTAAAAAASVAAADAANADDEDDGGDKGVYAGLHIPDGLRALPTDTAEQRERKRHKVKALKQAWKKKAVDGAAQSRAS